MNLEPAHEEQLHEGSTFPMGDPCCLDGGGYAWAASASMEIREKNRVLESGREHLVHISFCPDCGSKKRDFPWGAMTLQERSVLYIMPWICRAI